MNAAAPIDICRSVFPALRWTVDRDGRGLPDWRSFTGRAPGIKVDVWKATSWPWRCAFDLGVVHQDQSAESREGESLRRVLGQVRRDLTRIAKAAAAAVEVDRG